MHILSQAVCYPPTFKDGAHIINQNIAAPVKKPLFEMIVIRSEGTKRDGTSQRQQAFAHDMQQCYQVPKKPKQIAEALDNEGNEESPNANRNPKQSRSIRSCCDSCTLRQQQHSQVQRGDQIRSNDQQETLPS